MPTVRRLFTELPALMRVGLGLAALGGAIDIGYHLVAESAAAHGSVALLGHMTTLVGMTVTMLGLIVRATKHRPPEPSLSTEGDTR